MSSETEIRAGMKPLVPFWQWVVGTMFLVVGSAGGFFVITESVWSVIFSLLVIAGVATTLAIYLRNKPIPVTLTNGRDSVLIRDHFRPGSGKLVPLRVEQINERRIFVERKGSMWQIKRFELKFLSPEDTAKTVTLFRQYQRSN